MTDASRNPKEKISDAGPDRKRGREIVEHLRRAGGGNYRLTTEEIMKMTRGEDWGTGRLEEGDGDPVDLDVLGESAKRSQSE
jgi:hypothetical protein